MSLVVPTGLYKFLLTFYSGPNPPRPYPNKLKSQITQKAPPPTRPSGPNLFPCNNNGMYVCAPQLWILRTHEWRVGDCSSQAFGRSSAKLDRLPRRVCIPLQHEGQQRDRENALRGRWHSRHPPTPPHRPRPTAEPAENRPADAWGDVCSFYCTGRLRAGFPSRGRRIICDAPTTVPGAGPVAPAWR